MSFQARIGNYLWFPSGPNTHVLAQFMCTSITTVGILLFLFYTHIHTLFLFLFMWLLDFGISPCSFLGFFLRKKNTF